MESKKLLIVTYHFPPSSASGAFRLLGFARHLPSYGWNVGVVAPPTLPWEPVDRALLDRVPPSTFIEPVPYPANNKLARRISRMGCWLPSAWRACKKVVKSFKPDVILTSGPPHEVHFLGLGLKRMSNLPWIADFRDPWYAIDRMDRGRGLTARAIVFQERLIIRGADMVVANAPGAQRIFERDYPELTNKFITLPNGYDREAFDVIVPKPRPAGTPLRVVHTGAIYLGRDPRPFLDALRFLSDNRPTPAPEADFFGPLPQFAFDFKEELAKRALLDRVVLHGQVPYARCLEAMKGADILLLMDSPGRSVGVPAKLYEYIGAGRPILALGELGGDLEWVLRSSGVPYQIAPLDDPGRIAAALIALGREVYRATEPASRAEPFSRETIVGRLAECLDHISKREPSLVAETQSQPLSPLPFANANVIAGCEATVPQGGR